MDERALATLVQNLRGRGFADEELTGALGASSAARGARARDASSPAYAAEPAAALGLVGAPRTATRVSGANTRRG